MRLLEVRRQNSEGAVIRGQNSDHPITLHHITHRLTHPAHSLLDLIINQQTTITD